MEILVSIRDIIQSVQKTELPIVGRRISGVSLEKLLLGMKEKAGDDRFRHFAQYHAALDVSVDVIVKEVHGNGNVRVHVVLDGHPNKELLQRIFGSWIDSIVPADVLRPSLMSRVGRAIFHRE